MPLPSQGAPPFPLDHPSNMLLSHEHPSKCGRPGKRYSRYDIVSPIVDSIDLLHSRSFSVNIKSDQFKKATRKTLMGFRSPFKDSQCSSAISSSYSPKEEGQTKAKSLCMGCHTINPLDFTIDEHNFKVCKCGVVSGLSSYGVDYKEVNSTEKSDARADVRTSRGKDPIDHSSFLK